MVKKITVNSIFMRFHQILKFLQKTKMKSLKNTGNKRSRNANLFFHKENRKKKIIWLRRQLQSKQKR